MTPSCEGLAAERYLASIIQSGSVTAQLSEVGQRALTGAVWSGDYDKMLHRVEIGDFTTASVPSGKRR